MSSHRLTQAATLWTKPVSILPNAESSTAYINFLLLSTDCPPDPALGGSASFDFTQGASSNWTATGTVDYSSTDGATFTVAEEGDAPLITSDFYIMWGHVETVVQAAPGTGIISTIVMQSDTLDEIDIEFLGGDNSSVQLNYFGHGDTDDNNREQTISMANNQDGFHTYTVDWTADLLVWQIDGTTVRSMTPESADSGQYPQTPMMIKIGIWAGGDPSNPEGTISKSTILWHIFA
jgi:beta-glucanase (GH16 family)